MLPLVLSAALLSPLALANGQSTHVWISQHALEHLPEGELRELLTDPALEPMLANGTMFPDGGYPLGDGYAEIAHWEPFQNRYRDWIAARCEQPWPDDCRQHIAFLMGMASHGMADQVFDALYYERGRQYDPSESFSAHSFDQSTDVAMMALVGKVEYAEDWVPYETLVDLYAEYGHTVDVDTLEQGQALLRIAILWVGNASEDEDLLASETAWFPWLTSNLDEPDLPGTPFCEGRVVAAYWESVYRRLQGDLAFQPELLASFPESGFGLDPDPARVESRISLVFSQAIDTETLSESSVQVQDEAGQPLSTDAWMYYGNGSHVMHIASPAGWQRDAAYTVVVTPGLRTLDGQQTSGSTELTVSTAPPPEPEPEPEPDGTDSGSVDGGEEPTGCGCASGAPFGFSLVFLLPLLIRTRACESPRS